VAPLGRHFDQTGIKLVVEQYALVSTAHGFLMNNLEKAPDRPRGSHLEPTGPQFES
jgi:hypothetical protein